MVYLSVIGHACKFQPELVSCALSHCACAAIQKSTLVGANLFFQLISGRYVKGPVVTSNQSFGSWGEVFGDRIIATAILRHAITNQHSRELLPAQG